MILSAISSVLIVIGLVLVYCWEGYFNAIMRQQMSLANAGTAQYQNWIETPIDITFEAYLFNWTNSEDFEKAQKEKHKNKKIKMKFEQLGPYVYTEHHTRSNVVFNDNYTISFNTIRNWYFQAGKTNGSLDDNVTVVNPIALAVANVVRTKPYLIQRGVHYFFQETNTSIAQTKTVSEFMFDGYNDTLITVALALKIKGYEIPWDEFGWFYARNGTASYDGNYTMWTGEDDIDKTGIVTEWNESPSVPEYEGECSKVDGSTGEVWGPVHDAETISMFISDTCSKITLDRDGSRSVQGIDGHVYISTDKLLDNGTKYPETACFSPGVSLPSGVRNISECKYKAPAFISLPHFTLADESYRDAIEGMSPDLEKHTIQLVMEPTLGLPLQVQASVQCNLRMYNVDGIDMFQNVDDTMVPMLWVHVTAAIPDSYALLLKFTLAAPTIGLVAGYLLILTGAGLLTWMIYKNTKCSCFR